MRDAIVAALNVNIFTRHADRVRMINIVFHMYRPFQDAVRLPVTVKSGWYNKDH